MAQVRLTGEVEQTLNQKCMDSGRSLSAEADAWLRRALGLAPGRPSPAAQVAPKAPPAQQVITPAQGQGARTAIGRGGWQGTRPHGAP